MKLMNPILLTTTIAVSVSVIIVFCCYRRRLSSQFKLRAAVIPGGLLV